MEKQCPTKQNLCHNCGSNQHFSKNCDLVRTIYAIEVPEDDKVDEYSVEENTEDDAEVFAEIQAERDPSENALTY